MAQESKQPTHKVKIDESARADEFKAKLFSKSDWPKTPRETFRLVLSTFLNFFA